MLEVPEAAREAFTRLATSDLGKPLLFNPPYTHQAEAIQEALGKEKNLMVMTGTGSGKTEAFLLPILGKLAIEARDRSKNFAAFNVVRAIILYPMNALVNDQLGRLRLLFGDPRVVSMFEQWAGRPARFARYTSRTPYAGMRSPKKDSTRLASVGSFFGEIEEAAERHATGQDYIPEEDERGARLRTELHKRGKWPAKENISGWFGKVHSEWRSRSGEYIRGVLRPRDAELLTRHEVQSTPPDLLITNYSMLEYMMMRPIERPIFDQTKAWLTACPEGKILVVLDEAHLYRGAQGAEVGLLLRRLRERLGVPPERFQVICATASFSQEKHQSGGRFGAQLTGAAPQSFVPIVGKLAARSPASTGTEGDVNALCAVDLKRFYAASADEQFAAVKPFLEFRGEDRSSDLGKALVDALEAFPPFNRLVNETMKAALPLSELGSLVFPGIGQSRADEAIDVLLALGSRARRCR